MESQKPRHRTKRSAVLSGAALWKALGFSNERAFQRARQNKLIKIPMYPMPRTRGVFAYREDVERYQAMRQELESKIPSSDPT